MFTIEVSSPGIVAISGRLDAAEAVNAEQFIDALKGVFVFDLAGLEYVSSAGLGVLLMAHKRLQSEGAVLHLTQVGPHIADIFRYSGFDKLFRVDTA